MNVRTIFVKRKLNQIKSKQSCDQHRGTMRLLPLQVAESTLGMGGFHQIPIESGTPDRADMMEPGCDIDTLKKLKLGMRSSLWSRPNQNGNSNQYPQQPHQPQQSAQNPGGHPSDYSIAV